MRADAFGPAAVTGLAWQAPRRSLHRADATGAALASTAGTEVRRWRAGWEYKARRALSPPVLGRRCGVNCFAIQHNGLLHAVPPVARKLASCRHRAQPPLCLAPRSTCGACAEVRAVRSTGLQVTRSGAASGAVTRVGPRPPTIRPPRGLPGSLHCPAQRSAVLAASRPEPCGRASTRGLDTAARGTPWTRPVAFAECLAPHTQGERHATQEEPHHPHAAA